MKHDFKHTRTELETSVRGLARWFNSTAGSYLLDQEKQKISQLLPDIFGYHILQIGGIIHKHLLDSSRINHKVILSAVNDPETGKNPDLYCFNGYLPIASESIDVVVLPHVINSRTSPINCCARQNEF